MAEKQNVPTFIITLSSGSELDGPVVSPHKDQVATTLAAFHDILLVQKAVLCYTKTWVYVPREQIVQATAGSRRFMLPWPLA